MSEEEKKAEEAPAKKGKSKLIIIIVAAVLLLGGGVGAFLALGKSKAEGEGEEGAEEGGEEASAHGEGEGEGEGEAPPALFPLEPFIVNLQVKGSFLKTTLQLEFAEPELPKSLEHDTPKIRDAIIRVLSSKTAQEILTKDGKEKLREEIRTATNETLKSEDVITVYMTDFIIQ